LQNPLHLHGSSFGDLQVTKWVSSLRGSLEERDAVLSGNPILAAQREREVVGENDKAFHPYEGDAAENRH
jgi:hypothetical protein